MENKKNRRKGKIIAITIIVFIVILVLIISINSLKDNSLKNKYLSEIKNILANYNINDLEIKEVYKTNYESFKGYGVEVLSDEFSNLSYKEKEGFLLELTQNKLNDETIIEVTIVSNGDRYNNNLFTVDLLKNGVKFEEEDSIKEEILKIIENIELNNKEYIVSIIEEVSNNKDCLNNIKQYLNENEAENKIIYEYATYLHDYGNYQKAIETYQKIENYSNSKNMINECENMIKFQGTWWHHYWNMNTEVVIVGNMVYFSYTYDNYGTDVESYETYYDNNGLTIMDSTDRITINEKGNLVYTTKDYLGKEVYDEYMIISRNTEIPIAYKKSEPTIGMTKSEVENSTWGNPNKINKTTTQYGVHEQWVYSGNRYLYFDDGILTSIQE